MPSPHETTALLDALYRQHHGWLRGWLFRQLRCREDAADLTQDTFIKASHAPQLPDLERPRAFLVTLAKRLVCSFWRRQQLEQNYLEALAEIPEAMAPSAEELILIRDVLERVDALLQGLPDRARQVFLLNRLEGLTQPAIAARLGISLATVERDLRKAYIHCLLQESQSW